ncbi:MAG: hypothetical protein O3A00_09640 [Planctomycetota bacterium]|nr:hypothetical protein [Planctomycetota bacterium]
MDPNKIDQLKQKLSAKTGIEFDSNGYLGDGGFWRFTGWNTAAARQ